MIAFDYSTDYDPLAPVVKLVLRAPATGAQVGPLTGLVDSGADGTVVHYAI